MAGTYTLELELFSVLNATTADFEIFADGSLVATYNNVSSTGTSTIDVIGFGGALPASLEFRFNDTNGGSVDQIQIQSVRINGRAVDTGNYLSSDTLDDGDNSTLSLTDNDFLFDDSDPVASNFTVGATQTFTAGTDNYNDFDDATAQVFDMLGGRDIAYLGNGADSVSGGAGNDLIYGRGGNDLLFGGADNDKLDGGAGNDDLFGGTGDDRLFGRDGDDQLSGGAGNDVLNGNDGTDTIFGGANNDRVNGGNNDDILFGDDGDDQVIGGKGNDTLDGGNGNDLAYGGAGIDTIHGGDGADTLIGNDGDDTIYGDDDDDIILGLNDDDTLYGGAGEDYLDGGTGADIVDGGTENDIVKGGAGADTLTGGTGDDTLHGHSLTSQEIRTILNANPNVEYNAETNSFYEYVATNTNYTNAQTDALASTINTIQGHLVNITSQTEQSYVQTLVSGTFTWTGGQDVADNGEWIWNHGAEAGAIYSLSGPVAANNSYNNWLAGQGTSSVEDFMAFRNNGTWFDRFDVNVNGYLIEWDAGLINDDNAVDTLNGGNGNDTIYGYGGDDILDGEEGDDVIFGGDGNDTIIGDINVNTQLGNDSLYGGAGNDTIFGYRGDDIIDGGTGNDTLDGGLGRDDIRGGDGSDTIEGRGGGDIIDGGAGNDIIDSGSGQDQVTGGAGADTINAADDEDDIFLANGDFAAGESIDGGDDNDTLILTNATTVDFTTGTLVNLETFEGSSGDDDVTIEIGVLGQFTTADLDGGTDTMRVQISGTYDAVTNGVPTVSNSEKGFLIGSTGSETLTISGSQLNSLVYGGGGIDFNGGTNLINLTSNSTNLNALGVTDADIVGLTEIDASTSSNSINLDFSGQTEDFIITSGSTGDNLTGGSGDDTLTGNNGSDTLTGGAGIDTLIAGTGNDTLIGGTGADIIDGGTGRDDILLANGDFAAGESIDGGGGSPDELILTNATTVDFTTGTLTNIEELLGSTGNDDVTYTIDQALDFDDINLGGGTDNSRVQFSGNTDLRGEVAPTVTNTENGFMISTAGEDQLLIDATVSLDSFVFGGGTLDFGGDTRDVIRLFDTSTSLNTILANDASLINLERINLETAATGPITIDASGQSEGFSFTSVGSNNTIGGGQGNDRFEGFFGTTNIQSGLGNDRFELNTASVFTNSSFDGGGGTDSIRVNGTADLITTTITDIESLIGDGGNDDITLTIEQALEFSTINLSTGTDTITTNVSGTVDVTALGTPTVVNITDGFITGSGAVDNLTISGAQLDALIVGAGTIDLGAGADTINLTSTSTDLNTLGATDGSIVGLSRINASTAGGPVTINMSGQTENFLITGSANGDTITGSAGIDTINSGDGDDTVTSGNGNDILNGGAGTDTVVFTDNWNFYNISLSGSTYTIERKNGGAEGSNSVTNFENFEFADGTLDVTNLLAPEITSNGGGNTALINIVENTSAITTVTATNPNTGGSPITYSISGGADSAFFTINSTSGVLTFTSAPDFEAPLDGNGNNIYDLQITASDGTNEDIQNISVNVTDAAEGGGDLNGTTPGTAGTINVGESVIYEIDGSGDRDWFGVTLTGGERYAIWARGTPTEAADSTDPRIYNIFEADGTTVASGGNDDGGVGFESLLYFTPGTTGTYYIDTGAFGNVQGSILLSVFEGGFSTTSGGNSTGTADADYVRGSNQANVLNGLGGSDILEGRNGNDTLDGGTGADVLFGGSGADIFMLAATDAVDSIVDFNAAQGDVLDISNILVGFDGLTDDIDDYVQFQEVNGDTIMRVDVDGLANGTSFIEIASLEGNTGEVVQTLFDNGDIIV